MSCPHGVWHEEDCPLCCKDNEISELRSLIEMIFASTLPYNDGAPTFRDEVTDAWKRLTARKRP
jgi:hypothetical protein